MVGYVFQDILVKKGIKREIKMKHFEDKQRLCQGCKQYITIKFNQVGGFWTLRGWKDKDGKPHYGGYCSKCLNSMD